MICALCIYGWSWWPLECGVLYLLTYTWRKSPNLHKELEWGTMLVSFAGLWRIHPFKTLKSHMYETWKIIHAAHETKNHLQIIIQVPPLGVLFFKLSAAWISGRVVGWSQLVVLVLVLLLLLAVVMLIIVAVIVMVMAEQTFFLLNPFDGFSFCLNLWKTFDAIRQGITTKLKREE